MGFETILFAAFTGLRAISQIRTAKKQAEVTTRNVAAQAGAIKTESELATKERAKELRLRVARQTSSFLSSGLTLEGTPTTVLEETFQVGTEDIQNIAKNAQTSIDNLVAGGNLRSESIVAQGRTKAISTITSTAATFAGGDIFGSSISGGGGGTVGTTPIGGDLLQG